MAQFVESAEGLQHVDAGTTYARHRHAVAYAAIVVRGGYTEAGERGRHRVREGDVLIHDMFEPHADSFGDGPGVILNLHLPLSHGVDFAVGRVHHLDRIVRSAESDIREATALLLENIDPAPPVSCEWPDRLARDLAARPDLRLAEWAGRWGLAPETLSRGFAKAYGVNPARFRAEARARRAWKSLVSEDTPLAAIAQQMGFADQAHLTRAVRALTGRPPGAWRKTGPFTPARPTVH